MRRYKSVVDFSTKPNCLSRITAWFVINIKKHDKGNFHLKQIKKI